jgi:transposase-like protein
MKQLAAVGQYGPSEDCGDYQQVGNGNIIRYGKSRQGQQRYQCKTCKRSLNAHTGTVFYGRKRSETEILECLALLAEGVRISSISRTKGVKEDTIRAWLREAARHAAPIEAVLLDKYRIGPAPIDGLWTYVGAQGVKKTQSGCRMTRVNIGAAHSWRRLPACGWGEESGTMKRRRRWSCGTRSSNGQPIRPVHRPSSRTVGGHREALLGVYGQVPTYQGQGRPPTHKQPSSDGH